MVGTFFVVATPIGNLEDITLRALRTLKEVDIIACENTNHAKKLLSHFDIHKRTVEISPANQENAAKGIEKLLNEENNIALITDAGTPVISDPGIKIISYLYEHNIGCTPIPGVSAFVSALSVCPFNKKTIIFLGFLSKKSGKIEKELLKYKQLDCTLAIYVSVYQIKKFLMQIAQIYPDDMVTIAREMTKAFESFLHGTAKDLLDKVVEKGEFTVLIHHTKTKEK